jgi:hypothetical protein
MFGRTRDQTADERVTTLNLAYEQAIQERDRLRGARAFFARQLGPLPAFAGISAAFVGVFSYNVEHRVWMWIALGVLLVLILVSWIYSGMPAYRQLRSNKERAWREGLERDFPDEARTAKREDLHVEDRLNPEQWFIAQIQLERDLYGPSKANRWLRPSWNVSNSDLQDQLDRERTGVYVAQFLFVVVIGFLIAAQF